MPVPLLVDPSLKELNALGAGFPSKANFQLGTYLNQLAAASGGGGSGIVANDAFVATLNQTAFALSSAPTTPALTLMFVNGQLQRYGTNYTVAGSTLTWLNVDYNMSAGDIVNAAY